jgi:hypothetical protein
MATELPNLVTIANSANVATAANNIINANLA